MNTHRQDSSIAVLKTYLEDLSTCALDDNSGEATTKCDSTLPTTATVLVIYDLEPHKLLFESNTGGCKRLYGESTHGAGSGSGNERSYAQPS